jgi:methionyl aminopeptidase
MTEKSYGGNNGVREHLGKKVNPKTNIKPILDKIKARKEKIETSENSSQTLSSKLEFESYIKAGEIARKTREYAKEIIRPGILLLEIAQKIERKIHELGGIPAFPVNLSIDHVAAHYHPTIEDDTKAAGLLKVDIGIHVEGYIADSAFSLDLSPEGKYKDLISASKDALDNVLKILNKETNIGEIGKIIQETIEKKGFSPLVDLTGHELGRYTIHAGLQIPNYKHDSVIIPGPGAYAIEPFATSGQGKAREGAPSNIYAIVSIKNPRGSSARKILKYVFEKYKTLPFSLRELQEEFGAFARLGLKELVQFGIVRSYPQLIEATHHPVSQAEHSFIKTNEGEIIVYTK